MTATLTLDETTTAAAAPHRDATKSPPLQWLWTPAVADHMASLPELAEQLRVHAERTSVTIVFVPLSGMAWERSQAARFAPRTPLPTSRVQLARPPHYDWRKRIEEIEELTARGRFHVTASALVLARRLARYVDARSLSLEKPIPTVIVPLEDGGVQVQWTAREQPLWRHVEVQIPANVNVPMDEFSRLAVLRTTEEAGGRVATERTMEVTSPAELLAEIEWVLAGSAR